MLAMLRDLVAHKGHANAALLHAIGQNGPAAFWKTLAFPVASVPFRKRSCRSACTRMAIARSVRSGFGGTAVCHHRQTSFCGWRIAHRRSGSWPVAASRLHERGVGDCLRRLISPCSISFQRIAAGTAVHPGKGTRAAATQFAEGRAPWPGAPGPSTHARDPTSPGASARSASQCVSASNNSAVSALTPRRPLTIALRRWNGMFIRLAASTLVTASIFNHTSTPT